MSKPLLLLIGVSGSGKTSLANKLYKKYGYVPVKSYTTRPVREGDNADLNSHTFVTLDEADRITSSQTIVASNWFDDNYYFVTLDQLRSADTYVVDVKGAKDVYRKFFDKPIISIYLDVPPEIVAQRMERRGDSDEDIMRRLQHDSEVFKDAKDYCDFVFENNNQDQCNAICEWIDMTMRGYND